MSEEHDPTTDEQPAMPAWVPRSGGSTSEEPAGSVDPADPVDEADPAAGQDTAVGQESASPEPPATLEPDRAPPSAGSTDDSATRSFPPLGRVNPHPAKRVEPPGPSAAETPPATPGTPSWAPPAEPSTPAPPASSPPPVSAPPVSTPPPAVQPPAVQPPASRPQPSPTPFQQAPAPAPQPPAAVPPPSAQPPRPAPAPPAPQPAPPAGYPQPGFGQRPQAQAPAPTYGAPPPGGYPPVGPPPSSSSGSRRTILTVLGTLLAVGLVGGLLAVVLNRDDSSETATEADVDDTSTDSTDPETDPDEDTEAVGEAPGAEQLARSVVQIQLLLEGEPVCTGSGTIVDTVGTILTNFHVVEQSPLCPHDQIAVAVAESSQSIPTVTYVADLLVSDPALDLAVIRVRERIDGGALPAAFEPIELGDSDAVELGDEIRIIGFPGIGGETVTFTTGSVSGFAETPEGGERSWLKTDATIAGGNSGGLAADTDGRFVGIPTRAGSGSGQIVDCRVIADSNGDGRLSEDDSCVPIGGFINGVRPLSLALPLIEEAATATAIDQGPPTRDDPMNPVLPIAFAPTWTSALDGNEQATDELITLASGAPELCLTWLYDDVPSGALIEGIWLLDGDLVEEATAPAQTNDGPPDGESWACLTASDGLPAGVYEFAWFIDDELIFSEGFVVGDGATAIVDVVNESDMALCVVQFNPSGTSTWGLNELSEALEPGEVLTFSVAVGPTDVRVIDCNRDIHIEDASGFVIDEDLTITID